MPICAGIWSATSSHLGRNSAATFPTALLTDQASVDQVASLLSMHSRALHRRLTAAGTNFRGLVDECRFAIACQMLADTDADVSKISNVLNYTAPSAFARAFRRWSGTTPAAWRRLQQSVEKSQAAASQVPPDKPSSHSRDEGPISLSTIALRVR